MELKLVDSQEDDWNQDLEDRKTYVLRTLKRAIEIDFDEDDENYHGDIRFMELVSQEKRGWREPTDNSAPLPADRLQKDNIYRIRDLPLGSTFERGGVVDTIMFYNYQPRPSRGCIITISGGAIVTNGLFTDYANEQVILVDHPHLRKKPTKTAAMRRRTPSASPSASPIPSHTSKYKKKAKERNRKVVSTRRKKKKRRRSSYVPNNIKSLSPDRIVNSKTRKTRKNSI